MTTLFFRLLCCAGFLLAASAVPAANAVPNMEVVAMKGSSIVFRGFTDGGGRFATGPLEPGVYTIEVRTVPGTPPSAARFFLSLAGARPVGDATIRPGVALAMNAAVRNPAGIRGQVTARGGMVYVRPSVAANENNVGNVTPRAPESSTNASSSSSSPKMATSRPATANRPLPSKPLPVPAGSRPSPTPARSGPATTPVTPPSAYPPRIVDGKRYFWIPIAPGSSLGRWTPEDAAQSVQPARTVNTQPTAKVNPTPPRSRR